MLALNQQKSQRLKLGMFCFMENLCLLFQGPVGNWTILAIFAPLKNKTKQKIKNMSSAEAPQPCKDKPKAYYPILRTGMRFLFSGQFCFLVPLFVLDHFHYFVCLFLRVLLPSFKPSNILQRMFLIIYLEFSCNVVRRTFRISVSHTVGRS